MTALLTALFSEAGGYLIAGFIGFFTLIAAYLRGRSTGALDEKSRQAVRERDSYVKQIDDIKRSADAGRAVRPDDGGMQSDPNNRDNTR